MGETTIDDLLKKTDVQYAIKTAITIDDLLKKTDVQYAIKTAMDRRRDQIRRLFGYDPEVASYVFSIVFPILASIVFFMCYFLLGLYDTSIKILAALKWTVMIGIYMGFVFYMHKLAFQNVNVENIAYSIIPIVVLKILLWQFPSISTPFDNTLGVFYNRYFGPTSRLLENIKYEPLEGKPFDKISFPFGKIPLDWLINSLSQYHIDNIDNFLEKEPIGKQTSDTDTTIGNIYIQTTVDSDNYDVYGYSDVKADLNELTKWKRYIGHMTYDYIAFLL